MAAEKPTIHEVDFCSQIAAEVKPLIAKNPAAYPFPEARKHGQNE